MGIEDRIGYPITDNKRVNDTCTQELKKKTQRSLNFVVLFFFLTTLRGWVGTRTGKGNRLVGDCKVGPNPSSDWPTPPHSLHNLTRPHRSRPASCANNCTLLGLHLNYFCLSPLAIPAHAFICLCLTPLTLFCNVTQLYHTHQDHLCESICRDCHAGSHVTGVCICAARTSPCCL